MKAYSASTTIQATPERIWSVLTDAEKYPSWDPWAERVEGRIAPGERIKVYSKLSPGRAFPVKVSEFEPNKRMTWRGGLPLGLFKGLRTFTLERKGERRVEFTVREEFSGLLLPIFGRSLPDMTKPFEDFVQGLKLRSEVG